MLITEKQMPTEIANLFLECTDLIHMLGVFPELTLPFVAAV